MLLRLKQIVQTIQAKQSWKVIKGKKKKLYNMTEARTPLWYGKWTGVSRDFGVYQILFLVLFFRPGVWALKSLVRFMNKFLTNGPRARGSCWGKTTTEICECKEKSRTRSPDDAVPS